MGMAALLKSGSANAALPPARRKNLGPTSFGKAQPFAQSGAAEPQ
jgi:hypothetical protein